MENSEASSDSPSDGDADTWTPSVRLAGLGLPEACLPPRTWLLILMPGLLEAAGITVKPAPADPRAWLASFPSAQRGLLEKLNRSDDKHLAEQPVIVMPKSWDEAPLGFVPEEELDELTYSPLAQEWPEASGIGKTIAVDLALQVFGAYENGTLVRWGPISSGAAASPTPAGTYHLNWRARQHASTVNNEWLLPWYFNFDNRGGTAFHQYDLPGRAASHGCLRLLERDAKWLYGWGDTWSLSPDGREVTGQGTLVVITGAYAHRDTPPWRQQKNWLVPTAPPALPQTLAKRLRPAA